jgi:cobalt-precorrin 5A hydrolase
MKISLICFTLKGTRLCRRLLVSLNSEKNSVKAYTAGADIEEPYIKQLDDSLKKWTEKQFAEAEGIIFIGAAAIAVRTIAPFIKDKTTDPAVIVMDEKGGFVIPILSGHIGGANKLAKDIAGLIGAMPVITTATDINDKFAVDLFAESNNLFICKMEYAKKISSAVLKDQQIGFHSDFPVTGALPEVLSGKADCEYGICITLNEEKKPFSKTLNLIPKVITLGIGCRKGKASDELEKVVFKVLSANGISIHSVSCAASIDLKKEEAGLLQFCEKYGLELVTYPKEILEKVKGTYSESDYVKDITGIGNVCERAAVSGSSNGRLIQKKYAENGVTVSIAIKDWSVSF